MAELLVPVATNGRNVANTQVQRTRVKVHFSCTLLKSCGIHLDWAKIWFVVPEEVSCVVELLSALWRLLQTDSMNPQVKISCQGFYIPTSSSVDILREGDVLSVQLLSEEAAFPVPASACLSKHYEVYDEFINALYTIREVSCLVLRR